MTTICFKDGVLAADSKMNAGCDHVGKVRKIFPVSDGSFVAAAGAYQHVIAFVNWVQAGKKEDAKPKIGDDFQGVHVSAEKTEWFDDALVGFSFEPHRGVWAIGSGGDYALGAMLAGASADIACAIACELDGGSCVPITSVEVK